MSQARVHSLAGYGFEVPDVQVAQSFYGSFGLETKPHATALALGCRNVDTPSILILPGAPGSIKRLHHVSFFIEGNDLPLFEERLQAMGTPAVSPPWKELRPGLWFQDPWGTWFNLTPRDLVKNPKVIVPQSIQGARVDRHLWQELPRTTTPNKLGHLLMYTPDHENVEVYMAKVLGLRTSDRSPGKVTFMAGGEGVRDHHCFGLVASTHRGFQHASFHVDSIDQIGFGSWQMREAGFAEQFGPGRHALASNLFVYVRDPWGSWIEYYSDMDQISEAWVSRDWQNLPYVWGPKWSPEFWSQEMNGNHEPR